MNEMLIIWIVVVLVAGLAEALTTSLFTLWFFIGGCAAIAANLLGAQPVVQVAIFVVVSALTLILFRPMMKKRLRPDVGEEPSIVGQHAIVSETIDSAKMTGRVKTADQMSWMAYSESGETIVEGTEVRVVAIDSIKLVVTPFKSNTSSNLADDNN